MSKPLNIILLMTDQHRIDHVGCHPRAQMATPNIDRIGESVAFTNCQSANPLCQPARTALLTGKYSHQIGMLTMSGDLSHEHPTYPQALQKAGYHTAAVGKLHYLQGWDWFGKRPGGHQLTELKEDFQKYGFNTVWEAAGKSLMRKDRCDWSIEIEEAGRIDDYWAHLAKCKGGNFHLRKGNTDTVQAWPMEEDLYVDIATTNRIIKEMETAPADKPFFIFGSLCGPHPPYDPPQRFLDQFPLEDEVLATEDGFAFNEAERLRIRELRRAYKAMVACIDEQVGRVFAHLEATDQLDNTLILFTADHGEMLGDHGMLQKGYPYWQSMGIPAAFRHPQHLSKQVTHTPIELTDLTATILDAAGLNPQEALSKTWPSYHNIVPCRSLLPIAKSEATSVRDFAFSECDMKWHDEEGTIASCWQALTDERYKYVRYVDRRADRHHYRIEKLYDMQEDPNELVNLIDDPAHAERIHNFREEREYLMTMTPPAQTSWAPLTTNLRG